MEHRRSVEGPHCIDDQTLLRLSIGIEDVNDLIADFDQVVSIRGPTPERVGA